MDALEITEVEALSRSSSVLHRMSINIPGTSQTLDMYLADDLDDAEESDRVPLLSQSFSSSTLSSALSSSSSASSEGLREPVTPARADPLGIQTPFITNHTVLFTPARFSRPSRGHKPISPLSQIRVQEGQSTYTIASPGTEVALNPYAPSFRPRRWWIGAKSSEQDVESPRVKSFFTPGEEQIISIPAMKQAGEYFGIERPDSYLRRRRMVL